MAAAISPISSWRPRAGTSVSSLPSARLRMAPVMACTGCATLAFIRKPMPAPSTSATASATSASVTAVS